MVKIVPLYLDYNKDKLCNVQEKSYMYYKDKFRVQMTQQMYDVIALSPLFAITIVTSLHCLHLCSIELCLCSCQWFFLNNHGSFCFQLDKERIHHVCVISSPSGARSPTPRILHLVSFSIYSNTVPKAVHHRALATLNRLLLYSPTLY